MTKEPRILNKEKTDSSVKGIGKLDNWMQKNQTGLLSHIMQRNKLKMDLKLKFKTWNHKISRIKSLMIREMQI